MNCKNCNQPIQNNYCNNCGQKTTVSKITLASLLNELSESILQIDRGFFYTIKELFTRPGFSIREYIEGKRKRHFKPIAYVLTFSTLYFLVTQIGGQDTWLDELISGFSEGALDKHGSFELPLILNWIAKNYAYTALLLLPVFSLSSYICFLGLGTNYLEHVVINSYATGQQAIFYTLFAFLHTFFDSEFLENIPIFITVSYNIWVFCQFFKSSNSISIIVRSILTYILYLVLTMGSLTVMLGLTGVLD